MKKIVNIIPFVLLPILIPLYFYLDTNFFVIIFGCGCIMPGGEKNSLGNYFNANDFRKVIFSFLPTIIIVLGLLISKKFKKRLTIVIYNICVISLNVILAYRIGFLTGWK